MGIRTSRDLFGERPNAVYDVLSYLEPGLMLDVGAAAGMLTRLMLQRSPESRVIAFEPFPGNHPYIEDSVGQDPRVTIVKAAVADREGSSTFLVGKTVIGTEPGWESFIGYSSLGSVVDDSRANPATTITVPTARIDDYVGPEGARFMKVDVQGGELGVLQSAAHALLDGRIDLMFIEFSGDVDVLQYIIDYDFQVFDSEYLLIIRKDTPDLSRWQTFRHSSLSTGDAACRGWPVQLPAEPSAYCEMFAEQRTSIGSVWTDLVCVRAGFLDTYLAAAAQAAEKYGT